MSAALALNTDEPRGMAPDAEAGPDGPARRCIVTGEIRPKEELLRFVVGPDATVVPDVDGCLPGRGLWTLARRDIVAAAVGRRAFARAAKQAVTADAGLPDAVEALLAKRAIDLLGLARRAGQTVGGAELVRNWLDRGKCGVLIVAREASAEGRRKLMAVSDVPVARAALSEDELGQVFGRDSQTYVAVARGTLATKLSAGLARLAGFRGTSSKDEQN